MYKELKDFLWEQIWRDKISCGRALGKSVFFSFHMSMYVFESIRGSLNLRQNCAVWWLLKCLLERDKFWVLPFRRHTVKPILAILFSFFLMRCHYLKIYSKYYFKSLWHSKYNEDNIPVHNAPQFRVLTVFL